MPSLLQPKQLEAKILRAMKDAAPAMYRELKMRGELEQVIEDRASTARDSYETAMSLAISHATSASRNLTGEQSTAETFHARSAAAELAIAQPIEFQDERQG